MPFVSVVAVAVEVAVVVVVVVVVVVAAAAVMAVAAVAVLTGCLNIDAMGESFLHLARLALLTRELERLLQCLHAHGEVQFVVASIFIKNNKNAIKNVFLSRRSNKAAAGVKWQHHELHPAEPERKA